MPSDRSVRNPIVRALAFVAGMAALGLGIAGIWLPGLPGVLFLLIALWLFSYSNERMHTWMLENRWFGADLRDYHDGLGIPRRIKFVAIASITAAVTLSVLLAVDNWWWRFALIVLGAYGIWFVATRPTRETVEAERAAAAA